MVGSQPRISCTTISTGHYQGKVVEVNLLKKVRFEITVNDEYVHPTIDAITGAARTGKIGDGKIFVLNPQQLHAHR